jgi:protein gp37
MAARLDSMGVKKYSGLTRKSGGRAKWTGKLFLDENALSAPATWKRPRNVFVNSMSDLFHPDVPVEFIRRVWLAMAESKRHTYQILTKRPDRMASILSDGFPVLGNVWLGASVEDDRVLSRLDHLRAVPAAIRFVSFEPLIGSVAKGRLDGIHWAIVGGESGPNARPVDQVWIDEIFDMSAEAGSAFFFKQWGGTNKKASGRSYRGQFWNEMPATHVAP